MEKAVFQQLLNDLLEVENKGLKLCLESFTSGAHPNTENIQNQRNAMNEFSTAVDELRNKIIKEYVK